MIPDVVLEAVERARERHPDFEWSVGEADGPGEWWILCTWGPRLVLVYGNSWTWARRIKLMDLQRSRDIAGSLDRCLDVAARRFRFPKGET